MELAPFDPNHSSLIRITLPGVKTINGRPVIKEQMDAWVAEAEKGYDVATLRRRGRKPRDEDEARVISVRLSPSEISNLER